VVEDAETGASVRATPVYAAAAFGIRVGSCSSSGARRGRAVSSQRRGSCPTRRATDAAGGVSGNPCAVATGASGPSCV